MKKPIIKPEFKELVEYRIVSKMILREDSAAATCPEEINTFLQKTVVESPLFHPNRENFIVIFLNVRRKVIGFEIVAQGTLNSVLIHPREVFQQAIVRGADATVLAHNHPSGDTCPSEADIKITRDLIRAGKLLHIEVLDHTIFVLDETREKKYCSLRELGYFY